MTKAPRSVVCAWKPEIFLVRFSEMFCSLSASPETFLLIFIALNPKPQDVSLGSSYANVIRLFEKSITLKSITSTTVISITGSLKVLGPNQAPNEDLEEKRAVDKTVMFIEEQDLTFSSTSVEGRKERMSAAVKCLRNPKQMDFLDQMAQWRCQAAVHMFSHSAGCNAVASCSNAASFSWSKCNQREKKTTALLFLCPSLQTSSRQMVFEAETLPGSRCPPDTRKQRQRAGFATSCLGEVRCPRRTELSF